MKKMLLIWRNGMVTDFRFLMHMTNEHNSFTAATPQKGDVSATFFYLLIAAATVGAGFIPALLVGLFTVYQAGKVSIRTFQDHESQSVTLSLLKGLRKKGNI